jgi:dTDP-4-dehydrorhamnose reductase
MTDLIIGGDSIIGRTLYRRLYQSSTDIVATTRRSKENEANEYFDIVNPKIGNHWSFDNVYNCAGITSLSECHSRPEFTYNINVQSTINYLSQFHKCGSRIVYLSSNAVFDGSTQRQGTNSAPNPVSEYGRQKKQVERQLLALGERICVVRLTKVISCHLPLIKSWIRCLESGSKIFPFSDLYLSPISLNFATNAIANDKLKGIIHISGNVQLSYYDLAMEIARALKLPMQLVQSAKASDSDSPILYRPKYTSLDMTDTTRHYGIVGQTTSSLIDDLVEEYILT